MISAGAVRSRCYYCPGRFGELRGGIIHVYIEVEMDAMRVDFNSNVLLELERLPNSSCVRPGENTVFLVLVSI